MPHYPLFTNSYHRCLPGYYSELAPTPLTGARLLYHNAGLAQALALDPALFTGQASGVWAGERLLPGMQPLAQVYSGHQFGVWSGRLGDGRGILLGEQRLAKGNIVDWHLKGAGLTPYSRMGDGRAVLRSVVREFLASEALHHLGIATTRALTIVTSEEPVWREQPETGAMMMRIADSHVRFGHFEHFYYLRQQDNVTRLADYVIERHWPALVGVDGRYRLWLSDVVARTARMIAGWQACGFAHGVMNTDNMSILGLTIDYGPYGFLDAWQPNFICNHSDYQGRYAFDNQPAVALWNLNRLAQSLAGLMPAADLQAALAGYEPALMAAFGELMRAKLGLTQARAQDNALLTDLLQLMAREGADYTRTFRALSLTEWQDSHTPLRDDFVDRVAFDDWFSRYRRRLGEEGLDDDVRRRAMLAANPRIVLRNYLAQQAITGAEKGETGELARLHQALCDPYRDDPGQDDFAAPPPEWGRHLAISCSS